MSGLELSSTLRISTAKMNKYPDIGSPYLHPRPRCISSPMLPFTTVTDLKFFKINSIQFIMYGQKLKIFRDDRIYS